MRGGVQSWGRAGGAQQVFGCSWALGDRWNGHIHGQGQEGRAWGAPTPQHPTPIPPSDTVPPLPRSLWVQVWPSQPSRQMQEKESPLPTQVPPFMQGLGRQLLFLAVRDTEGEGGLFTWR